MSPKEDILEAGDSATPEPSERTCPIIAMKKGDRQVDNPLVAVIDEGTRTARFAVFDPKTKNEVISHQLKISMISPSEGWFEQDPMDILGSVKECIREVTSQMASKGLDVKDIVALGVTNQRETTIVWDKKTGAPLFNALVWYDIRTDSTVDQILAKLPDQNKDYLLPICGLPVSTYFSALKLRWLLDHIPAVRKAVQEQRCLFGTVDTWLIWNLTGGVEGGLHVTDVTNASRTMLMNIDTLEWDPTLCKIFKIPMEILPEIRSSSEICGYLTFPPLDGVPISGILGNQQAALVGQHCLQEGLSKNTYRSGCFLLYNTGHNRVLSTHGLVTTVAYQMGPTAKPVYALEGSVAVAGNAIKWLRDKLNVLSDISETESLAEEVMTTGDVYFVPAFNGLYAPYWRKDARGILCGLTQFTTKAHLIRAALEAVCFQTRDILEAMHADCGVPLQKLRVDGMMSQNSLLMQLQADLCGIPVVRAPHAADVTSLGVAMAAGWAHGVEVWDKDDQAIADVHGTTFEPVTNNEERNIRYTKWKMAVQRSLGWATHKRTVPITEERYRMIASVPGTLFCFTSFLILVISEKVKNR